MAIVLVIILFAIVFIVQRRLYDRLRQIERDQQPVVKPAVNVVTPDVPIETEKTPTGESPPADDENSFHKA